MGFLEAQPDDGMPRAAWPSPEAVDLEVVGGSRDIRCSSCGYDLHGLADEGQCPECGNSYSKQSTIVIDGMPLIVTAIGFLWPLALALVTMVLEADSADGSLLKFVVVLGLLAVVCPGNACLLRRQLVPTLALRSSRALRGLGWLRVRHVAGVVLFWIGCLSGPTIVLGGTFLFVFLE